MEPTHCSDYPVGHCPCGICYLDPCIELAIGDAPDEPDAPSTSEGEVSDS